MRRSSGKKGRKKKEVRLFDLGKCLMFQTLCKAELVSLSWHWGVSRSHSYIKSAGPNIPSSINQRTFKTFLLNRYFIQNIINPLWLHKRSRTPLLFLSSEPLKWIFTMEIRNRSIDLIANRNLSYIHINNMNPSWVGGVTV